MLNVIGCLNNCYEEVCADHVVVQNTAIENCVLWTACIISWIRLILNLLGIGLPAPVDLLCDCMYCALSACMQSQQEAELKFHKGGGPKNVKMEEYV